MRRAYFRTVPLAERAASGHGLFRSKDTTSADITQLPVVLGLSILPDRVSSGHVTDVTSGEKAPLARILRNFLRITYFRSRAMIRSPSHATLFVPFYYLCR